MFGSLFYTSNICCSVNAFAFSFYNKEEYMNSYLQLKKLNSYTKILLGFCSNDDKYNYPSRVLLSTSLCTQLRDIWSRFTTQDGVVVNWCGSYWQKQIQLWSDITMGCRQETILSRNKSEVKKQRWTSTYSTNVSPIRIWRLLPWKLAFSWKLFANEEFIPGKANNLWGDD